MKRNAKVIGLLDYLSKSPHRYYPRLAGEYSAREQGYDVIAVNDPKLLLSLPLTGVLYQGDVNKDRETLNALADQKLPTVMLNCIDERFPAVNAYYLSGTVEAIKHLVDLGKRKIAYVKGTRNDITADFRYEAFKQAMKKVDVPFSENRVVQGAFFYQPSRDAVIDLLNREPDIDAIICCTDRAAMGTVQAVKQSGRSIPEQIAVIGLGNLPEYQELSEHPLSTQSDPIYYLGYLGVSKLIRRIEGRDTEPDIEWVTTYLIKRQTTLGDAFIDPILGTSFTAERGSLNYILSVGASLSEESRNALLKMAADKQSSGERPLEAIRQVILKAVSLGLDAAYAHEFMLNVDKLKQRDERKDRPISEDLHSILSNLMTKHGRYQWLTHREADSIIAEWMSNPEIDLSMTELLTSFSWLRERLLCRFIALYLLEELLDISTQLIDAKGTFWIDHANGLTKIQDIEFADLNQALRKKVYPIGSISTEFMVLSVEGKIVGALLVDSFGQFGLFNQRLKPLIESKLHRIRLFERLDLSKSQLEEQTRLAEKASKAKSEFLAVMSHEIRTPLNCIIGMTELTLDLELSENQRNYLELALRAGKDQLKLINDLLNLSKIEQGAIEAVEKPFSLRKVVEHITDVTQKHALDKGLAFEVMVAQAVPDKLIGDREAIHTMATNLVGNAIKFTESGKVSLKIDIADIEDRTAHLRIQVSDTGIGIAEENIKTIFSPFEQADQSNTRAAGGVGLGLAIVKGTLQTLGGWVDVKSSVGKGSCFTLQVPLAIQPSEMTEIDVQTSPQDFSKGSANDSRYKIMVVDDNESNQLLVRTILGYTNLEIESVNSGFEALEHAQSKSFDCILMDVGMPGMNGYETTRKLRTLEETNQRNRTPIIALTAHTLPEDERACLASGMDGFLPKPFNRNELVDTVLEYCRKSRNRNGTTKLS